MYFNLYEAKYVKDSEAIVKRIEEAISFFKEKGGDAVLSDGVFSNQITFENNKYHFRLNISIPFDAIR
jgi:hypothetical protein